MKHRLLLFSVSAAAFATAFHPAQAQATPWSFGVISDTQWLVTDDGKNPNTIAANIIKQVDSQFIAANVKLVVSVGDMADIGSQTNDYVRALYAQDLYNAGIGFYPTRGNHEAANGTYTGSGADFRHAYPQIVPGANEGSNNSTPADITTALVSPAGDLTNNPPATATGAPFSVGNGFSTPTAANLANDSVSYAFNYGNVTFMLLDQFQSPDYYTSHVSAQMGWVDGTLAARPANTHAFVFTHKNMLGGNHKDNMFGAQVNGNDPGDGYGLTYAALTPDLQTAFTTKTSFINSFLGSMQSNDVKYVISGHDHHHYNSIVTSPDLQSKAHQLICASDSSKFYTPGTPISGNDLPVEQQLNRIGYYIFTVDGPRVTIDYYADVTASNYKGPFNFVKQSTTGYSLNGQEFVISEGAAYTSVTDNTTAATVANGEAGYVGTSMSILNGTNTSTATNNYSKAQAKAVNTGWAPTASGLASDVLSVWGLQQIGAAAADTYALSVSYSSAAVTPAEIASGAFVLASKDLFGHWVNAVDMNKGGVRHFVSGAYNSSYPLGTCGVDSASHTVWAVVNHQGDFAAKSVNEVVNFIYTSDNHYGIVRPLFRGGFNVTGQAVNEAMIARMNTLPTQLFPNDGGVASGQQVGQVDFLMDTGDIANRSETGSIAVNHSLSYLGNTVDYPGQASYVALKSNVSWSQWQHGFLGDNNTGNSAGGLLSLTNSQGQGIPVFLSPGNHDISNAIGMTGKIATGDRDTTSFVQIFNRMTPYSGKAPITTSVFDTASNWNGQNAEDGSLIATRDAAWPGVELFRVDSPMKGDFSGVSSTTAPFANIGDERLLSFQVYSYDIATRRLTEREFLWNPTADATGTGAWSAQAATINLSLSPTTVTILAGPANDSTVTDVPTLAWSSVYAATGYTVAVTGPNNAVVSYDVTGTSLTLGTPLTNGLYTWTVTANNIEGSGPVSASGNFNLLLPPTLSISAPDANGNVNVSWPATNATGYHLEFSPDMTNWVPVSPTGFFRLVKP